MATFEELQKEMEPHKGNLVLNHFEVVRLVDVVNGEDDYYWVFKSPVRGTYWSSCVGGWMPLKGKIAEEDYMELERVWGLNEERWDVFETLRKEQRAAISLWVKDEFPQFGEDTSDYWDWDGNVMRLWVGEITGGKSDMKMYTLLDLKNKIKDFPEVKYT